MVRFFWRSYIFLLSCLQIQYVVGSAGFSFLERRAYEENDEAIVYCNDEFLLHDYAPNRFVGEILVHGTFFVVGNTQNDEGEWESCSLTEEQVEKYMQQFWAYLVPIEKLEQQEEECDESEDIGLSQI